MKLVLLWFGSWKNSMSCYAPAWVKNNPARFPLVENRDGRKQAILSPFSENNLQADIRAYSTLLQYIKKVDAQKTVIMVQVENEVACCQMLATLTLQRVLLTMLRSRTN